MTIYLDGLGLFGPGLPNWPHAQKVFAQEAPYRQEEVALPTLQQIPPREARRLTHLAKLALCVTEQALKQVQPVALSSIFMSSAGDHDIFNDLCQSLAEMSRAISPTKFSHSLLNAVAGVWGIAAKSHERSISISAGEYIIGIGWLETILQITEAPVLLVFYDAKTAPPLAQAYPIAFDFAAAFVLSSQQTNASLAKLETCYSQAPLTQLCHAELAKLQGQNPLTDLLPLLEALANPQGQTVTLAYAPGQHLSFKVLPCN